MQVSFHTDPVDIPTICADVEEYGAVFIETTRTNFRKISDLVEDQGTKILPLAVQGADGDFHNFLLRFEGNEYDIHATNARVLKAIEAWQSLGCPYPHVEAA